MPPDAILPNLLPLQILVVVWFTVLGTVFGSFMNVVVYRLPRGLNLALPGSHCPVCKKPIRWFDNLPVLSWLVLRGRCRDCKAAISPRYLFVEVVTGGIFGLVAWVDFAGPLAVPARGWLATETVPEWLAPAMLPAVVLTALHLLLVCTFFTAALIEIEDRPPPARLFWPLAVVGAAVWLTWPMLQGRSAAVEILATGPASPIAGILAAGTGASVSFAAGWLLGILRAPRGESSLFPRSLGAFVFAGACLGIGLGWEAAAVIPALALVLHAVCLLWIPTRARQPGIPWTGWMAVLALAWIVGGHRLAVSIW